MVADFSALNQGSALNPRTLNPGTTVFGLQEGLINQPGDFQILAYNGKRMDFHNVYHKVKKYRLEDHGLLDCNMFDPIDPLRKSFPDIKERLGGYSLKNVCTYFKVKVTYFRSRKP